MKKILISIVFLLVCICAFTSDTKGVFICTGGKSTKYHKTATCRGLSRCSGQIKKITIDDASKMGRTPCSICYK